MREIKFRAWDGLQTTSHKDGEYIYVKADWHPMANKRGYVKRHRLVLEQKLGAYLPKYAVVHHVNGNKQDDRPENLEYHPDQKFHAKSHDAGKRNSNGQFVADDPIFQEIKFRLLNKHTGLYEFYTLAKLIKTTFRNSQFKFAGRFTGLKDKNGKEIYEGDIIKDDEAHYKIYWSDGCCAFDAERLEDGAGMIGFGCYSRDLIADIIQESKYIGNIYENPELLKPSHQQ